MIAKENMTKTKEKGMIADPKSGSCSRYSLL